MTYIQKGLFVTWRIFEGVSNRMITCLDCAWYSVCEPGDVFCACEDFIRPEELQRRIGQALYEELLRHRADSSGEEKPKRKMD